jgi:hypothetical protein
MTRPTIDFPQPPVDRFPDATIERPNLKARYDVNANRVEGWMLARTVKGDVREYTFEVVFDGSVPRPKVSVASHPNALTWGEQITGLPKDSRKDLRDYARRIGVHLRDLGLDQQQWLLEQFETVAQLADVVSRRDGKPPTTSLHRRSTYATLGDWFIRRTRFADGTVGVTARRMSPDDCVGDAANGLKVVRRPAGGRAI